MCVRACASVVSRRVDLPNLWFIVRNSSRSRSCASFYAPAAPITSRAERALTRARRLRSVWENERSYLSDGDISRKLLDLWHVMDSSIHAGVSSTEPVLPGRLQVRRRAPHLYRRLFKGFYPSLIPPHPSSSSSPGSSLPPPSATQPLTLQHGLNHHAAPPPSPSGGAPRSWSARSTTLCRPRRAQRASSPPSTGSVATPSPSTRSMPVAGGSSRRRRTCALSLSLALSFRWLVRVRSAGN